MALTLSRFLGNYAHRLLSKSRSLDEVGYPFGVGVPLQATPNSNSTPSPIPEHIGLLFWLSQDLYPVLGTEGTKDKPMRYRIARCQRYHETNPPKEDCGALAQSRADSVNRHNRIVRLTAVYDTFRRYRNEDLNRHSIFRSLGTTW